MTTCRFCDAPLTLELVNLGRTPLANSYLPDASAIQTERTYPLRPMVCETCWLVQVESVVEAQEIFGDYAYFSSMSTSWLDHARTYAHSTIKQRSLTQDDLVVEVASNDGYLLRWFAARGYRVLGIEPAENVAEVAREHGVRTRVDFFGTSVAREVAQENGRASLVIANNVLAHVPDINDFVQGIALLLSPEGRVSIEFPHLLELMAGVQFDTIYHEHYSYLSLNFVKRLFEQHGLTLVDVERLPTHGGSLRAWGAHVGAQAEPSVDEVLAEEVRAGLEDPATYQRFATQVAQCKQGFAAFLEEAQRAGKTVAAYGAAAKGNTFLNFCGVGAGEVAFVVDRSPYKQGRLLPGSHIPILAPEAIDERRPDYLLVLPWNLRDEIAAQTRQIRGWGGRHVIAVPSVEVF